MLGPAGGATAWAALHALRTWRALLQAAWACLPAAAPSTRRAHPHTPAGMRPWPLQASVPPSATATATAACASFFAQWLLGLAAGAWLLQHQAQAASAVEEVWGAAWVCAERQILWCAAPPLPSHLAPCSAVPSTHAAACKRARNRPLHRCQAL